MALSLEISRRKDLIVSKHHKHSEPLPLARRRLADAVCALVDPVPTWTAGRYVFTPATYLRLRGALQSRPAGTVRLVPDSRPPCHSGVLALIVEIDGTAAKWESGEKTTIDRLRQVALRDRAPEDVPLIDGIRETIETWTERAADLLADRSPEIPLRLACPNCQKKHVYRPDGTGDNVRSWALRVSEDGARCLGCNASWKPDMLEFLATRLLGLPPLPT